MPADFEKCVTSGGKVRTKKLKDGRSMNICFKDGKSYAGEAKVPKGAGKKLGDALKKAGRNGNGGRMGD